MYSVRSPGLELETPVAFLEVCFLFPFTRQDAFRPEHQYSRSMFINLSNANFIMMRHCDAFEKCYNIELHHYRPAMMWFTGSEVCICVPVHFSKILPVKHIFGCNLSDHNLTIYESSLPAELESAAFHRVLFTSHIYVLHFLQFISHCWGCIIFNAFLPLSPHLILKCGGQNNGGTKERGNKSRERGGGSIFLHFPILRQNWNGVTWPWPIGGLQGEKSERKINR